MIRLISPFVMIFWLAGFSFSLCAQSIDGSRKELKGTSLKSLVFVSKTSCDTIHYSLYLPPGYQKAQDSFPVFYLLHGLGGNENSWTKDFLVDYVADSLIQGGRIPPLILVMPEGKKTYFINDYRKAFPYEDAFIGEFIPLIDSIYRTKAGRTNRAIGGLSMGGFGALISAFRHPECFSTVVALSAAVRTDSMIINEKPEKYRTVFSPLFGDSIQLFRKVTCHWMENNPLYLTAHQPDTLRSVSWFIDCGLNDYLLPGNEALHDLFTRYRIPHEYHVRPGNHDRAYWKASLVPALLFAGSNLNR